MRHSLFSGIFFKHRFLPPRNSPPAPPLPQITSHLGVYIPLTAVPMPSPLFPSACLFFLLLVCSLLFCISRIILSRLTHFGGFFWLL